MTTPDVPAVPYRGALDLRDNEIYNLGKGANAIPKLSVYLASLAPVYGFVQGDKGNNNVALLPFTGTNTIKPDPQNYAVSPLNNRYNGGFAGNTITLPFTSNTFNGVTTGCTFGTGFYRNVLGGNNQFSTFGADNLSNNIGADTRAIFGDNCESNEIGASLGDITLGNNCTFIEISGSSIFVTVGDNCRGVQIVDSPDLNVPAGTVNARYVNGVKVAANTYTLVKATTATLGGIIIGTGFTYDPTTGKLSVASAGPALSVSGALLTYNTSTGALTTAYTPENAANKGVAGGYVPLDANGKIDPSYISVATSGKPAIVSSGEIADLTSAQQALSDFGSRIITTVSGYRYQYTGSGSKTDAASYIQLADITPDWSVISGKPAFATVSTTGNTSDLTEGSNKFFTDARAAGAALTGYVKATAARAIAATDTLMQALGLLEKKVDDLASTAGKPANVAYNVAAGVAFTQALTYAHYPTVTVYDETRTVMLPLVTVAADFLSFTVDFGGVAATGTIAYA